MTEKTKLSLILMFPPFLLWFFVLLLGIDKSLAAYMFERITSQTSGIIMVIAGFVFPGTSLFTSISCLLTKEDTKLNIIISILSGLLLLLFAGFILIE
ncbi:MAG TPA: hypothetical protein VJ965_05870 [Anaerolineales bacterium]|nr:hypothetical protein [Anaerolineales bacterium]